MAAPERDGAPATVELASPLRRLGGKMADGLLLFVVAAAFFDPATPNSLGFRIATVVTAAAYEIGFVATRGQTPGKMLARTRVVTNAAGQVPTWRQATARWLVEGAPSVLSVAITATVFEVASALYAAVVYAPILTDGLRQGIHDRAAGTMVVSA